MADDFDEYFVVEVRNGFDRSWSHGFEIVEREPNDPSEPRMRLRRMSDGRVLPGFFSVADVLEDQGPDGSDGAPRERRELLARETQLLAERDRIGRELHQKVIQRLFGIGIRLQGVSSQITDDRVCATVLRAVDDIDIAVAAIRSAIFDMGGGSRPLPHVTLLEPRDD